MAKIIGIFMDAALIRGIGNAVFISCRTDEEADFSGDSPAGSNGSPVKSSEYPVILQWAPVLLQCSSNASPMKGKKGRTEAPIRVFFGTLSSRWDLENQAFIHSKRRWEIMVP
jgi:hypothetical protein